MNDITKCYGDNCKRKESCRRYKIISPYSWYANFEDDCIPGKVVPAFNKVKTGTCWKYFIPIGENR